MVAIFLTSEDVADMDFDNRGCDSGNSVMKSHRGVAVASCVEDNPIVCEAHLMNLIDQLAFDIALKVVNLHRRKGGTQFCEVVLKSTMAINIGLANPEKVEIGTVYYHYFFHDAKIRKKDNITKKTPPEGSVFFIDCQNENLN